jgi:putative phage-type endonuclease
MNPELIQGSAEWLAIRKTKVTATDAPALMNVSPYGETPYKRWLDKLGFGEEQVETEAMRRGRELEIVARDLFIKETGIMIVPEVVFSKEYDFMMSSLDGIDFDKTTILEIKCVKKEFHEMALDGVVPEGFMPQLQHQMITTGLKKCYYLSYSPASYKILEVYLDEEEAKTLIEKEKEFFNCIQNLSPPPLTEKDYVHRSDQEWTTRERKLKQLIQQRKELELEEEMIKKELIELSGGVNTMGEDIKLSKVIRAGQVDYKNMDILKGVDLNPHRKPSSVYYRFS